MKTEWFMCNNKPIKVDADAGYDGYLWSTGETTPSIYVNSIGNYEVTVFNNYGDTKCESSKTISLQNSSVASITAIEISDWSQDNNAISVYVEGDGNYEFSIDNQNYQDSNVFENLRINDYYVFVRDKNGCGNAIEKVYLLYYPRFFTPNGDGYNDTWQVINSDLEKNNKVYIFDRFGKLLTEISPFEKGWNGTFNGRPLPENEYWFKLERQNGETYHGHFSLKRN